VAGLVSEGYPTELIDNKGERAVVEVLQGIPDSWLILSNLNFVLDGQTHEIDVVLLHPALGGC
jgi:hypothetical protein